MTDTLITPFGNLQCAPGLYARRTCSAEQFRNAVAAAHMAAWQRGEDGFVYSDAMAIADGVIA